MNLISPIKSHPFNPILCHLSNLIPSISSLPFTPTTLCYLSHPIHLIPTISSHPFRPTHLISSHPVPYPIPTNNPNLMIVGKFIKIHPNFGGVGCFIPPISTHPSHLKPSIPFHPIRLIPPISPYSATPPSNPPSVNTRCYLMWWS